MVRSNESRIAVRASSQARTADTTIISLVYSPTVGSKPMLGHRTRIVARRGLVIGVAGVVAGLLGAGIASAAAGVNQCLSWSGNFPIIGTLDPIVTDTVATLPSPVTVGQASSTFPVSVTIDAP